MKPYRLMAIFYIAVLCNPPMWLSAQDRWIDIDAALKIEGVTNKLKDGWRVDSSGDPEGINKDFTYEQGVTSATPSGWRGEMEETFDFSITAQPADKMTINAGFEAVRNTAQKLWRPIRDEKRMELNDTLVRWTRGKIDYAGDVLKITGFRGVGHPGWDEIDLDMFGFYPALWEVDRYRRVSGRIVPRGGSVEVGNPATGKVTYTAGEELLWHYGLSHYAKYNKRIGKYNTTLFYKREEIPFGKEDEKLNAWQLTTKFPLFGPHTLQIGVLFQPFRLHQAYQYIEEVKPGTGVLGSDRRIITGETDTYDAWGETIRFTFYPRPVIDACSMAYQHVGLVAGNKDEWSVSAKKKIARFISTHYKFTAVKPIREPVPLLTDQVGSVITAPRGVDSPFRVSDDPHLPAQLGNREKNVFDLTVTFDPTPVTWFYRWEEGIIDEWNINPAENALFSSAVHVRLLDYPGTTDNVPYHDEHGQLTFVPATYTGLPPTRGYLPSVEWMGVINLPAAYKLILGLGGGQKPASTILADEKNKNYTNYLTFLTALKKDPFSVSLRYERDNWGPEDFNRDFGEIADRLLQATVFYEINEWFYTSAEYIYSRRIENLSDTYAMGSFDEIRLLAGMKFGALILADQRPIRQYQDIPQMQSFRRIVPKEATNDAQPRPEVKMHVDDFYFSPDGDGVNDFIAIRLIVLAGDIESWDMSIIDNTDRTVKRFSGRDEPPKNLWWDGIDDDYNTTVGEGTYTVHLKVTDRERNYSFAVPIDVKVEY